jgi:hypothetical protein
MDDSNSLKPIWKGPIGRRYTVAIYYENDFQHFSGLKSIPQYFRANKYCPGGLFFLAK